MATDSIRTITVVALISLMAGCHTVRGTAPTADVEVVERSKATRPDWTWWRAGQWDHQVDKLRYVHLREDMIHLSLGLRQMNVVALAEGRRELQEGVLAVFRHLGQQAGLLTGERLSAEEVEVILDEAGTLFDERAQIGDVYYERVVRREGGTDALNYRVWVMVEMPAGSLRAVARTVGRSVKSRDAGRVSQLADLVARVSRPIAH